MGIRQTLVIGSFVIAVFGWVESVRAIEIQNYQVESLGTLSLPNPGYLNRVSDGEGGEQLLVSSFSFFQGDAVTLLDHLGGFFAKTSELIPNPITRQIVWPNEISWVGPEVLGRSGWLVASGFLPPGKSTGAVTFVDSQTYEPIQLTQPKSGFFYHRTQVVHWGPSQSLAILTARASRGIFTSGKGELVLLVPKKLKGKIEVEETILASGPDVYFRAVDLDGSGVEALVATEFFGKKLDLFWWENGQLHQKIIDDDLGTPYDVIVGDLNRDGQLHFVVTNHESGPHPDPRGALGALPDGINSGLSSGVIDASVFAYEVPGSNYRTEPWLRHTVFTHIPVNGWGIAPGAPGSPLLFYPSSKSFQAGEKPWILISGDASYQAHVLVPQAQDWSYRAQTLFDAHGTVGKCAVLTGPEGRTEIAVPVYDRNEIHFLEFNPSQQ